MNLPLGTVVRDNDDYPWVYFGASRMTTGNHLHRFVRTVSPGGLRVPFPWLYQAAFREALVRKFPSLTEFGEDIWA